MNAAIDLAVFADWLGTFAIHSLCACAVALLVGLALRDRFAVWQERLLRFVLWAPFVSSAVQFFVLGGPWTGGFGSTRSGIEPSLVDDATLLLSLTANDELPATVAPAVSTPVPWSVLLSAGAGLTAVLGLLCWWRSRRRLARVLADRGPERDPRVLAEVATVARRVGLHRPPRTSRSDRLSTPIAFGTWRPEVCLPSRVAELGPASLQAMLAHEFAHLRRRDPAVMAAGALLQALLPWQLLLPLVRRRWLRLAELRCDAIAAGHTSPTAVARCLLEVAEWLRPPAIPALGMAARPSALRDRVEAALHHRGVAPPRRLLALAFSGVSLSTLTLVAPGAHAPAPGPASADVAFVMAEGTSPAHQLALLLEDQAALAAEAERLQSEFGGTATSPELEQLLSVLRRRLLVVERLAMRIEARLAAGVPEPR